MRPIAAATSLVLAVALSVVGCARSSDRPVAPDEAIPMPAAAEPESQADSTEAQEQISRASADPNVTVIDMAGEDAEPASSQSVVAQPKRPTMPSMMPGVVTGPSGMAPGG